MQTFFYVLGPFLLYAGGGVGLAAIGVSIARAIWGHTSANIKVKKALSARVDELKTWAKDADGVLASIVVQSSINPALEQALPEPTLTKLYDLTSIKPADLERMNKERAT